MARKFLSKRGGGAKRVKHGRTRPLHFEPLEARELLTTVVGITASQPYASEEPGQDDLPVPGQFTVTREAPYTGNLSVSYEVGGTAGNGFDYSSLPDTVQALGDTVVIPDGYASKTIDIYPIQDPYNELSKTIILTLDDGAYYDPDPNNDDAMVTIADNDNWYVQIVATDAEAAESSGGEGNGGEFTVTRYGETDTQYALDVSTPSRAPRLREPTTTTCRRGGRTTG